jgi:hypothetical protein
MSKVLDSPVACEFCTALDVVRTSVVVTSDMSEWDEWIAGWLLSLAADDIAASTLTTCERGIRQLVSFLAEASGGKTPGNTTRRDVEDS